MVIAGSRRLALDVAVAVSVAPLAVWLWSRTLGMPFGPRPGIREPVGLADSAAVLLEVAALVIAALLIRGGAWLRRPVAGRARPQPDGRLVVAVAALGCGGRS